MKALFLGGVGAIALRGVAYRFPREEKKLVTLQRQVNHAAFCLKKT